MAELARQMYSSYKAHHALLWQIMASPNGMIQAVSQTACGRATDVKHAELCQFSAILRKFDTVLADKGVRIYIYVVANSLRELRINEFVCASQYPLLQYASEFVRSFIRVFTTKFGTNGEKFSFDDSLEANSVNQCRVVVENTIHGAKLAVGVLGGTVDFILNATLTSSCGALSLPTLSPNPRHQDGLRRPTRCFGILSAFASAVKQ